MTGAIPVDRLHRAILHGAARTRERRDELNRINVFPVVDNDTGTNLAHTMQAILRADAPRDTIRSMLRGVARSALVGARGNSGAIFSQYFHGLSAIDADKGSLTLDELAAAFRSAYEKAYRALEKPVEGTVLTVMRAWAVGVQDGLAKHRTPHEAFDHALGRLKEALEETRTSMRAMREAGVVDAGALGFYHFMEGFVHALLGHADAAAPEAVESTDAPAAALPAAGHASAEDAAIAFRYCTEVLLASDGGAIDEEALRADLQDLGDCLLVSGADDLARVHVHTDRPWEAVRRASRRGRILEQKADDMVWQHRLAGPPEDAVAVVTDSVADLPRDFVHAHGIFQVPIHILSGDADFLDKVTMDPVLLAEHLGTASTAQPNAAAIRAVLEPLLAHFREVLVLTVSSKMSGTHTRFREALDAMGIPATRARLVDTRVNSGAQGLLVREAVRLVENGATLAEAADAIEALRERTRIVVSVRDIGPMARSGRVNARIGALLVKLRFQPLITIDREGEGSIQGVAFSPRRNRRLLLRSLKGRRVESWCVVHAGAPDDAEALRRELAPRLGAEPAFVTEISSVVTLFAGKGSVAVAYVEQARTRA